jgi:hypothetical protein
METQCLCALCSHALCVCTALKQETRCEWYGAIAIPPTVHPLVARADEEVTNQVAAALFDVTEVFRFKIRRRSRGVKGGGAVVFTCFGWR